MKITLDISCVYDYIWDILRDVYFAEKLRLMMKEMRYVKPAFDHAQIYMCEFTNWEDMCEKYEEHPPAFFV